MKNDLDVLFVHPNAAKKIYQDLSKDFSAIEPPIWCALLANYVRNKGFNTHILDCEANRLSPEEAASTIKGMNPKVVCLVVYGQQPSASTQNMVGAMALMDQLKSQNVVRMYIGPHVSALPKITIQQDPDVFVCQGEGPRTLEKFLLVKDYNDASELKNVPGLWFFDKKEKTIVNTPVAPLIFNLDDELGYMALDLLPMEKYRTANWHSWSNNFQTKPFGSIYTSLGCPFKCSFCMINAPFNNGDVKNNTFRFWNPSHMIKTFDKFADLGITNVKLADEMFVFRRDHFLELCKLIIDRGYKFNIWAYARIDTVREEYLTVLKKAGVNWLGLGIESGNQKVRQEVTKGKFQELNIRNIVNKIVEHDIFCTGNFIFGLPEDTYETMQESLDLAMELNIDYANFYCAMAYPGSQLHREYSQNNPEALPENAGVGWIGYSQHAYECFNLRNKHLTNAEILKFRDEAFEKFFRNEAYISRMVKKVGEPFKQEMDRMLAIKLKRKLLGD